MKTVKIGLKIDNYEDRKNMIIALANSGYNVRVHEKNEHGKLMAEYYVIFEGKYDSIKQADTK